MHGHFEYVDLLLDVPLIGANYVMSTRAQRLGADRFNNVPETVSLGRSYNFHNHCTTVSPQRALLDGELYHIQIKATSLC